MSMELYNGNCLDIMMQLPKHSVDMVLADLPYNSTPLHWDKLIPHEQMWECYRRVCKPNSAIVLFGQEPFASHLRLSNEKEYRYDWYWEKERLTNVFQVKRRCGKTIENIMVFYKEQPIYNPQKHEHIGKLVTNKIGDNARFSETQAGEVRKNRYRAFIYNKGKCIELGVYDTLEEAKEKRLEAEYIYFGEFRNKENEM